jgi:L-ribulokinase
VEEAQAAMTGIREEFAPDMQNHTVYNEMYRLYRQLHDAFGTADWSGSMANVMKDLIAIREQQRKY